MYTRQMDEYTRVDYYDTLYETIQAAREGAPYRPAAVINTDKAGLNASCNKALYGWPEGLKLLSQHIDRLTASLPSFTSPRVNRPSMTVGRLNIDRYSIGHPALFDRRVKTVRAPINGKGKIIRVVYNYAISPNIGAKDRFESGAAVVCLIQALEANGYQCELIMVNGNRNGSKRYHIVTKAKGAGQPLSLESVAFLLCSSNMDHHIAFSLFDRWDDAAHEWFGFSKSGGSYFGAVTYFPPEYDQSVKIGAFSTQDDTPADVSNPRAWIASHLKAYGIEVSN